MTTNEIVTVAHLEKFKQNLLQEIKSLLEIKHNKPERWMKRAEALKLLQVSPGTLQTMRNNNLVKSKKIMGTIYYDREQIEELLK